MEYNVDNSPVKPKPPGNLFARRLRKLFNRASASVKSHAFEVLHLGGVAKEPTVLSRNNSADEPDTHRRKSRRAIAMLLASTALVGLAFTGYAAHAALTSPPSAPTVSSLPSAPDSVMLSLVSPLKGADIQRFIIDSNEIALGERPDLVQIKANSTYTAQTAMLADIKAQIIKNGGPLAVIDIPGDGGTNNMTVPEPSPYGYVRLSYAPPHALFQTESITILLQAMTALQQEEFPGHKAGEPLAKTFIITGCDVFSRENSFDAVQLFDLSEQLRMPIMASVTETTDTSSGEYGSFVVIRPNGTWSPLPGPSANTRENVQRNEAWLNSFPKRIVKEPQGNNPFSITALPAYKGPKGPIY
jgi:hypothetical protein